MCYCKDTLSSVFVWTADTVVSTYLRVYHLARALHTWICGCGF